MADWIVVEKEELASWKEGSNQLFLFLTSHIQVTPQSKAYKHPINIPYHQVSSQILPNTELLSRELRSQIWTFIFLFQLGHIYSQKKDKWDVLDHKSKSYGKSKCILFLHWRIHFPFGFHRIVL